LKVNGRQRRSGNTSLESGTRESADRVSRVTVRAGGSTPRAGNTEANGAVLLVQAATVRSAPEVVSSGEMSGSAVRFAGKEKPARGRSSRSHGMKSAARGRPGRLVAVAEAGKLPPVAVIRPTSVAALLKASAAERRIASFVDANAGRSVADSVNAIAANAVRKGRDPMVRAHARTGANVASVMSGGEIARRRDLDRGLVARGSADPTGEDLNLAVKVGSASHGQQRRAGSGGLSGLRDLAPKAAVVIGVEAVESFVNARLAIVLAARAGSKARSAPLAADRRSRDAKVRAVKVQGAPVEGVRCQGVRVQGVQARGVRGQRVRDRIEGVVTMRGAECRVESGRADQSRSRRSKP